MKVLSTSKQPSCSSNAPTIHHALQVAFASDFTQMWDDKSLGLKRAKGTGKMILLITKSLQGLDKAFRSDLFFRVREKILVLLHVGWSGLALRSIQRLELCVSLVLYTLDCNCFTSPWCIVYMINELLSRSEVSNHIYVCIHALKRLTACTASHTHIKWVYKAHQRKE